MSARVVVTVVLAATSLEGRSTADPAASADAAKQAEAFAQAGDFRNAAARYRAAYAADPKPELICNVGVAYYKAKDLSPAQFYLSRCLERGTALAATFTESVRAVMGAVENTLRAGDFTPVDIVVEPKGASVGISGFAADESFVGSRVIWLPFGTHKITASYDGYAALTIDVEARTHTTTAATLTLVKSSASLPIDPPRRTRVVDGTTRSKLPAIAVTAGSVAAIVVAALAYSYGHKRADLARFALTPEAYAADRDAVDRWNRMMAISGAIAIAGASVSGFLWYRAFHTESHVELDASADHATLTFGRSW